MAQTYYIFIGFTDEEQGEVGIASLCQTNDQGASCRYGRDGEHGYTWLGTYRGLDQSFRQALDGGTRSRREELKIPVNRCQH